LALQAQSTPMCLGRSSEWNAFVNIGSLPPLPSACGGIRFEQVVGDTFGEAAALRAAIAGNSKFNTS
jgi:hypothetical protein